MNAFNQPQSLRDEMIQLVSAQYEATPEYLWKRYPGYAVLRHSDNRKWFTIFMDVPANKLGLPGDEIINILDVKVDPVLADSLLEKEGILPGYHMHKGNWITILLDGTVKRGLILSLIDMSFQLTAKNKKGK